MIFTVPSNSSFKSFKIKAAPKPIAECTSWPHACITPGLHDLYGTLFFSSIGNASISARNKIVFLSGFCPLIMATIPV